VVGEGGHEDEGEECIAGGGRNEESLMGGLVKVGN